MSGISSQKHSSAHWSQQVSKYFDSWLTRKLSLFTLETMSWKIDDKSYRLSIDIKAFGLTSSIFRCEVSGRSKHFVCSSRKLQNSTLKLIAGLCPNALLIITRASENTAGISITTVDYVGTRSRSAQENSRKLINTARVIATSKLIRKIVKLCLFLESKVGIFISLLIGNDSITKARLMASMEETFARRAQLWRRARAIVSFPLSPFGFNYSKLYGKLSPRSMSRSHFISLHVRRSKVTKKEFSRVENWSLAGSYKRTTAIVIVSSSACNVAH